MSNSHDESPVNPLPPVVVALALLIFGVEIAMQLGAHGMAGGAEGIGWRVNAARSYGFSVELFRWMLGHGRWPLDGVMRFVTYPFIHGTFTHALMVIVFLLALGKMVGEVFGTFAVLLVFFGSAAVGAAVYGLVWSAAPLLIGGFPAVYGLIGSYSLMLWLALAGTGANRLRAFNLIALLMGLQLVFGLAFGGGSDWVADLSGFATGFLLSFLLVPGALRRIVEKLRQR